METIVCISSNFQSACSEKEFKCNSDNSLHLGRKSVRIFVLGDYVICSLKLTGRFSEQIMSANKYPGIFSRQMEAIVYVA